MKELLFLIELEFCSVHYAMIAHSELWNVPVTPLGVYEWRGLLVTSSDAAYDGYTPIVSLTTYYPSTETLREISNVDGLTKVTVYAKFGPADGSNRIPIYSSETCSGLAALISNRIILSERIISLTKPRV